MRVLITGAAGGLGRIACKTCINAGHIVFGCDLSGNNQQYAPGTIVIPTDVTDIDSVLSLSETLVGYGSIDAIVHLAGVFAAGPLLETETSVLTYTLDVNLLGVARINLACARQLVENKGRIIIVSSELGVFSPAPFTGQYVISKHALESYATTLRREVKSQKISVTTLRPGSFSTGMHHKALDAYHMIETSSKWYGPIITKAMPLIKREMKRSHAPEIIASTILRTLETKHPKRYIAIKQSPLLLLMNLFPVWLQDAMYATVFTNTIEDL
ncbi:MAG: SDR family NAD(P)-dependent oxidoreductase [Sphaerochaetaceae bacterium]|jgi:NAD(P)-dependent dehydrogenase (short-subunit alcohol dehydrogenase family)|nr:SDR family NAD(P)-dependent oxidoreductase [Sphaerochaetaceae bacterium]NLO60364.1 SDR family NAD(P)-dependent oxidoreductase [Spirochaetales bacterium]MDD3671103.1 SDR family NAD(P)-dependent oxidoreductase [Sphaerochaetaceae bacterium]MDD4258774.1 SDR family NAD(P)-dependent oxidoreductase [Sphaerochaetaceae bacterium]MDD4762867.1 SDR family NAD(P)-dependent oxidoreductase [Sphaerochaetaceae bacterium]